MAGSSHADPSVSPVPMHDGDDDERRRSVARRLVMLVCAWSAVAIGIAMLVRAELGVAPFDVLNSGLADTLEISFGTAFLISSFVFYGVGRLLGGPLGWASPTGTLCIGPMINVVLDAVPETDVMLVRVGLLVGGILVLAFAVCLGIVANFGTGPTEVFMLGLIGRGMGVVTARWISDGLPVVIGVVLGGALGVGTALMGLAFGPLIKFGLVRLGFTPPTSSNVDPDPPG